MKLDHEAMDHHVRVIPFRHLNDAFVNPLSTCLQVCTERAVLNVSVPYSSDISLADKTGAYVNLTN